MAIMLMVSFTALQAEKFNPNINADMHTYWENDIKTSTKELSEAYIENVRMCKKCIGKAHAYKATMEKDEGAVRILDEYIRRLDQFCGPITSAAKK